jgi:Zn-dependent protease
LAGIEIRLDGSLLIIFVLLLVSLGAGVFPTWHSNWGTGLTWLVALAAAVLFFASILAHEFSHWH